MVWYAKQAFGKRQRRQHIVFPGKLGFGAVDKITEQLLVFWVWNVHMECTGIHVGILAILVLADGSFHKVRASKRRHGVVLAS